MADELSFILKFPFKGGDGNTIIKLPIKRLKRKDITVAQSITKDEGVMEDMLVAKMLGITLEDLGEFDIADSKKATEVLREMAGGGDVAGVLGRGVAAGVTAPAV
jgi:hypothetical protein